MVLTCIPPIRRRIFPKRHATAQMTQLKLSTCVSCVINTPRLEAFFFLILAFWGKNLFFLNIYLPFFGFKLRREDPSIGALGNNNPKGGVSRLGSFRRDPKSSNRICAWRARLEPVTRCRAVEREPCLRQPGGGCLRRPRGLSALSSSS